MAWEWSSVRTKVAKRLVLLFVVCALAPLCAFAALASWMVTRDARDQLLRRLHVDAKAVGMGTVERIEQARTRLQLTAEILALDPSGAHEHAARAADAFDAVWIVDADGHADALRGHGQPPALSTEQQARLAAGDVVIATQVPEPGSDDTSLRLDMAVQVTSGAARRGDYVIASADARRLWDLADDSTRPPGVDACVLDEQKQTLACSDPRGIAIDRDCLRAGSSGTMTWRADGRDLLGGYWSAPLAGQFKLPSWTFVVVQPADAASASTLPFRRAFAAVIALTMCVIVLFSLRQIRRRLEPLERLHDGAARIQAGDFGARASIASGDEFEALAESFNLMAAEVQRRFADLQALSVGTFEALARTIDAKSPWTAGHSQRVTWIGVRIGIEMGLSPDEIEVLRYGGLLHDIGKLGVPGRILDKAGRLTPVEVKIIRQHPELGARILEPIAAYAPMIPIVLEHHERWDGSGYPRKLKREEISLGGRIFAVADTVDAMLSNRPYRSGIPIRRVIRYIADQRDRHFDPHVVDAFLRIVADLQTQYEEPTSPEDVAREAESHDHVGVFLAG